MVTTKRTDGIEFLAMDLADIDRISVVPQTLDNQWVPREMLAGMIATGQGLADVERARRSWVRAEYVRALVNTRQVIVNRAYLYNNPVILADYLRPGDDREAFEGLLRSGVLVAFLFSEESPYDEPAFSTDPRGLAAWREVARSVPVSCMRLSWDDDENRQKIREQLRRRFHTAAQDAVSYDTWALSRDLKLPIESETALRVQLGLMAHHCVAAATEGRLVTREELYGKFVVTHETAPAEGRYDASKPFAAEIKQLLDLNYNVNLPDALDAYALTPFDSLQRTALQEWHKGGRREPVTATELLDLLRRMAFDLVQGGLYLRSFGTLRLSDVREIRLTDEWAHYTRALDALLADPLSFADPELGAPGVYRAYTDLAKVATRIGASGRMAELASVWNPVVELVVEVAGAALSVVWGAGVVFKIAGVISSKLLGKTAPLVVRLVVRGLTGRRAKAELSMSCDFMRAQLQDAAHQWDFLTAKVREIPGWVEARDEIKARNAATISVRPEEEYV
ncbi:MAG: hypothetical protein ACJ77A_14125 [Actinomycetota bacterium]